VTSAAPVYRGRIAPTPTGHLHLGHARTFGVAWARARACGGALVLRNEDLDRDRCRPEFAAAFVEDLRWFGLDWDEGPEDHGPFAPYRQSARRDHYLAAWARLRDAGAIYPSPHSRRDVEAALGAPHEGESEAVFPPELRAASGAGRDASTPAGVNWRFRVPDGETVRFTDLHRGPQAFVAGRDFGDFVVWRRDDIPAYELAVVVDDIAMRITEVVRGEDLLLSTARQLLIYRALGAPPPAFFHCPLMVDENGRRLAKRHRSLSLRELRARGADPAPWREEAVLIAGCLQTELP